MIREERLLKVILAPHVSEKSTIAAETNNTVPLRQTSKLPCRNCSKWKLLVFVLLTLRVRPNALVCVLANVAIGKKLTLLLKKAASSI